MLKSSSSLSLEDSDESLICACHSEFVSVTFSNRCLGDNLIECGRFVALNCDVLALLCMLGDESGDLSASFTIVVRIFCNIDYSQFSKRVFEVVDVSGDGDLDFGEFFIGLYNYCSYDKSQIARFAFNLFDVDKSGEIEKQEGATSRQDDVWKDMPQTRKPRRLSVSLTRTRMANYL